MIIVKLMGGLGNQMFQYAFGRSVSLHLHKKLFLDLSFFNNQLASDGFTPRNFELSIFELSAKIVTDQTLKPFNQKSKINILRKKIGLPYYKTYQEKGLLFDNTVFDQKTPVCFSGYWQSDKYFNAIAETIKKDFAFSIPSDKQTNEIANEILNSNSVSIHFRRGDYITSKITNSYHGVCSLDYYYKAKRVLENNPQPNKYFIFSDNLEWVKTNFQCFGEKIVYVQNTIEKDSWKDMYLMSLCKHNIIANSSFSWWGAWLNKNPDKIVIAPKQWFAMNQINDKDLVPEGWIKL